MAAAVAAGIRDAGAAGVLAPLLICADCLLIFSVIDFEIISFKDNPPPATACDAPDIISPIPLCGPPEIGACACACAVVLVVPILSL